MRLLRRKYDNNAFAPELVLEEFFGQEIPQYAILSHTWGKDEVLFSHIADQCATARDGYMKVFLALEQAESDGLTYIWIDTCCIDKRSSAELSEAINSMYVWYRDAQVCYVYLEDVTQPLHSASGDSEFCNSRWFTRGWCLQELIAPSVVRFYSQGWQLLGERVSMCRRIANITGIEESILTGDKPLEEMSIAQRMSWAAHRQTTRSEDMAYCLMGIFFVNMPLLYGEGTRAFQRLQEEIMKYSDDQSLFAWTGSQSTHGLLADSPSAFAGAGKIIAWEGWAGLPPYEMTNKGLRIDLHLTWDRFSESLEGGVYLAALNCSVKSKQDTHCHTITLLRKDGRTQEQWMRVNCNELQLMPRMGTLRTIYVGQTRSNRHGISVSKLRYFQLLECEPVTRYEVLDIKGQGPRGVPPPRRTIEDRLRRWLPPRFPSQVEIPQENGGIACAILFRRRSDRARFVLILGRHTAYQSSLEVKRYHSDRLEDLDVLHRTFAPHTTSPSSWLQFTHDDLVVTLDSKLETPGNTECYILRIRLEDM